MNDKDYIYRCSECGSTADPAEHSSGPECCDKKMVMEPLPQCTEAEHPEMVRNSDESDACDDGRGKNAVI